MSALTRELFNQQLETLLSLCVCVRVCVCECVTLIYVPHFMLFCIHHENSTVLFNTDRVIRFIRFTTAFSDNGLPLRHAGSILITFGSNSDSFRVRRVL